MKISSLVLAAALAVAAPLGATAATITGQFATAPTVNLIDAGGRQGGAAIEVGTSTGPSAFNFVFELTERATAFVLGNIRQSDTILGFTATVNGEAVNVTSDTGDQLTFRSGTSTFMAGDQFDVMFTYDSAHQFDIIDFGVTTAAVPVPAAGLLLLSGLLGTGMIARRRKN